MEITPIAYFHSPLTSKFGIPRQSGLSPTLAGTIVFTPEYRHPDAIRGLDGFDYLWLIWEFSANNEQSAKDRLTVRPPRLGGNERIGVFASRRTHLCRTTPADSSLVPGRGLYALIKGLGVGFE